ncbi:putative mitochondrial protein AtMg00860 [Nicotiana tabacum]|uniref:Mitochondrial protein AtMg00860 n=1 Tax=Nicotiana tabacum TaxID=4097 RepID=A0AC58RP56_TOBAC
MVIAQKEIDFLGMHFIQSEYSSGPHICQELLKFPDTNFTTKQIQEFLGILNYVRDFIPNISSYISPLTKMLKKNAPSWGEKHDEAVKKIKEISKSVKSLYIPSDGKKILQTDGSHEYWSAVLFEEKHG